MDLTDALAAAAEASTAPALWVDMVHAACRGFGADTGAYTDFTAEGHALRRVCPDTDPALHRRYLDEGLHQVDFLSQAVQALPMGGVVTNDDVLPGPAYAASAIFQRFIAPQGMGPVMVMALTGPGDRFRRQITLGRRLGRAGFSPDDRARDEERRPELAEQPVEHAAHGCGHDLAGLHADGGASVGDGLGARREVLGQPLDGVLDRVDDHLPFRRHVANGGEVDRLSLRPAEPERLVPGEDRRGVGAGRCDLDLRPGLVPLVAVLLRAREVAAPELLVDASPDLGELTHVAVRRLGVGPAVARRAGQHLALLLEEAAGRFPEVERVGDVLDVELAVVLQLDGEVPVRHDVLRPARSATSSR